MVDPIRRTLLTAPAACAAAAWLGVPTVAEDSVSAPSVPGFFPRQDPELVRAVVGASHARFDQVDALVSRQPELAKACVDWGYGDWESAVGAASHMGDRRIAELLMEHGARPTLFTMAMLGQRDAVMAAIDAQPGIQRIPGPHGISLMQHARQRLRRPDLPAAERPAIESMIAALETVEGADGRGEAMALTDGAMQVYLGQYAFGDAPDSILVVDRHRRGWLTMARGDGLARRLRPLELHVFAPQGAPSVRVRFEVVDGESRRVTVHDPEPIVSAVRRR